MIRAVAFALVVAVASAAFIPVLNVDGSYPHRDEFDRPIYTLGQKAAFDVRTKTVHTDQDVPIVQPVAYAAAPFAPVAAPFAPVAAPFAPYSAVGHVVAGAPYAYGFPAAAVRYI